MARGPPISAHWGTTEIDSFFILPLLFAPNRCFYENIVGIFSFILRNFWEIRCFPLLLSSLLWHQMEKRPSFFSSFPLFQLSSFPALLICTVTALFISNIQRPFISASVLCYQEGSPIQIAILLFSSVWKLLRSFLWAQADWGRRFWIYALTGLKPCSNT